MKRIFPYIAAFILLIGCEEAAIPDEYGTIMQVRQITVEDKESSGGGGGFGGGGGGGGVGELIVLAVIGVILIVDVLSEDDLHIRKAYAYDVRMQDGTMKTLLQDASETHAVLEPGQTVVLHYGKGDAKGRECVDAANSNAQGTAVLKPQYCGFEQRKPEAVKP